MLDVDMLKLTVKKNKTMNSTTQTLTIKQRELIYSIHDWLSNYPDEWIGTYKIRKASDIIRISEMLSKITVDGFYKSSDIHNLNLLRYEYIQSVEKRKK